MQSWVTRMLLLNYDGMLLKPHKWKESKIWILNLINLINSFSFRMKLLLLTFLYVLTVSLTNSATNYVDQTSSPKNLFSFFPLENKVCFKETLNLLQIWNFQIFLSAPLGFKRWKIDGNIVGKGQNKKYFYYTRYYKLWI